VDQFARDCELEEMRARAHLLPRIQLDAQELADLELIAVGALSPLRGFMTSADYASVRDAMRLVSGIVWPLPINLAVPDGFRWRLRVGSEAALADASGRIWAILRIEEIFQRDPAREARAVYQTDSANHPGVSYLFSRPRWLVGGEVRVFPLPLDLPFAPQRLSPRQIREIIAARGWSTVAGFQTRNPIHRAHEHLTKVALEVADGLLIHPLIGQTKSDDVPASVRFLGYQALLDNYYPKERTVLAAFPAAMRYAGPREALFHALVRKNYGVTHLIVGRDHAGVGQFYGPFDAQRLFDEFRPEEIGVVPLRFEAAFFCARCGSLASAKTCPHDVEHRLTLSGSKVREILRGGGDLPEQFTRREVAELLRAHYQAT
jgi:sulfate adenylyltransferase